MAHNLQPSDLRPPTMKHMLTCLLAACLLAPAWCMAEQLTLEEFVQKLEKAKPWKREKIETLFGVKFTVGDPSGPRDDYTAYGPLVHKEGLIIEMISHTASVATKETFTLEVFLDNKSNCFTRTRIEKSYPGGKDNDIDVHPGGEDYYEITRAWGKLIFGFGDQRDWKCLTSIVIGTNALKNFSPKPENGAQPPAK